MPTNPPGGYPQQPTYAPAPPPAAGYGQVPQAYVAPCQPAQGGQFGAALTAAPQPRSKRLGKTAFWMGLFAAVIAPVLIGIGLSPIAPLLADRIAAGADPTTDLLWLSPVAGWELLAELALYAGTIAGLVAIIGGFVAAIQKRGRAWGVWGIVLGVIAPVIVAAVAFTIFVVALSAVV